MIPVILSGGGGTRLWPMSRTHYPKQFLPLTGEHTMLQETLTRLSGLADLEPAIVIANNNHRFLVAEQLQSIGADNSHILLEPVGRNTAPAVALAAFCAQAEGRDPLLLVLPADHVISDKAAFHEALSRGQQQAENGQLVTFGITANSPETGFGYIKRGAEQATEGAFAVAEFVEKPDSATAQSYLDSGQYYWNSGMFLFKASVYLEELKEFEPAVYEAASAAFDASQRDLDFLRIDATNFANSPNIAIDYAVMERTQKATVVALDAGWNDLGSWSSMWDHAEKDEHNNAIRGDVITEQSSDNLIFSEDRLVTTIGVSGLVVVQTTDAILVADKEKVQDVKKIVEALKSEERLETDFHSKVHRPWGNYEGIALGDRYQVKCIEVKQGSTLSLQMHHHRAEHWIVVSGTAEVTKGEETFLLSENQSVFIPLGVKHRLKNTGAIPLRIIEVQSGSYLGEDDIVRFEDVYGRA